MAGAGAPWLAGVVSGVTAAVVVLAGLAAVGAVDLDFPPHDADGDGGREPVQTGLRTADPREFIYLDTSRSEGYLAQLDLGLLKLRNISKSTSAEAGGEISVTPAKLTAKIARENTAETQFDRTATSTLQELWDRLESLGRLKHLDSEAVLKEKGPDECVRGHRAPLGDSVFARTWCDAHAGNFVTFKAKLYKPLFVQAYQKLLYAKRYGRLHGKAKVLLAEIGKQPRLPLVADMPTDDKLKTDIVRLVLPVQRRLLTREPTLFAARLRVLAKVVRRIDTGDYGHLGFYTRFRPLLWKRYAPVRKKLGLDADRLRQELAGSHPLAHPAGLLLPLAIFN